MRTGETVFVDTGAWIALALARDPLHERAREAWEMLRDHGAALHTSAAVVMETFTFLERNTERDVALAWKDSMSKLAGLHLHPISLEDLEAAWQWFERPDLHKLSAVDATSFVVMHRKKIRVAFAFDHHFAMAGFRMVG